MAAGSGLQTKSLGNAFELAGEVRKENGDRYSCWMLWTCEKSAVLLLGFSELSSCLYPEGQITWLLHGLEIQG